MFAQPNGPRQNVSRPSFHGQPIHVYANQWAATIFIFSSLARNLSDATRPIGPQSEGFCSKKFFHIRCCACAKQMVHNNVLSLQKKIKQIRYCLATHWTATMCSCFQKKNNKTHKQHKNCADHNPSFKGQVPRNNVFLVHISTCISLMHHQICKETNFEKKYKKTHA